MTALFAAGLAYTSFANLGILTRQKSLRVPVAAADPVPAVADAGAARVRTDGELDRELVPVG